MKVKIFCYNCEAEFAVASDNQEPVTFCPFCGNDLSTADTDDIDDSE